jgi:SAM-dependent methyltransferase
MNKAHQWNQKAQNYNRYKEDADRFEAKLLKKILDKGLSFSHKTVIDVGAGTGVYTLRLAQSTKEVFALDFSEEMLKVLEKDAQKLNLKNILTCKSSWTQFHPTKHYDIAFSTMSPALESNEDFAKFHEIATTKIYLGWAGKRDSDILNALFLEHDAINTPPNGAKKLRAWLKNNQISFTCEDIEELKISTCKCEDAYAKYAWHLEIRNVKPKEEILKKVLKDFCKDSIVTERTTNQMQLIIWQ